MITQYELVNYLHELLRPDAVNDYCPNGLQVEGKKTIRTIVTGVTACQALLDEAIKLNADAVLVHHGYFWRNETLTLTGIKRTRIQTLFQHNINLFAYHLPLDIHPALGNNTQLGTLLNIPITLRIELGGIQGLGAIGHLPKAITGEQFSELLTNKLQRPALYIAGSDKPIETIAWCTGAAQNFIQDAAQCGVDAYLTGEVSEQTYHLAKELTLHFFAAGHHATERYGIQALGQHLAEQFSLQHHYIDIDNPV